MKNRDNQSSRNAMLAALAGLTLSLLVSDARADVLFADFDLDKSGNEESSVWSVSSRDSGGVGTLRQKVHYGATDASRNMFWSGLGLKGKMARVDEGDTTPPYQFQLEQTTKLAFAEKAGRFTWTNPADNASIDDRAKYFAAVISNASIASGSVAATIGTWDNPIDGLVNQLTFTSVISGGAITHSLTNHDTTERTVNWSVAGITGKIRAGETLSATVNAPTGAIERRGVAVFQVWSPGIGLTTFEAPIHHWIKAPRVPAPGPVALLGLGALTLSTRRRA